MSSSQTILPGFDFSPRTRLVFGEGSVERLGGLAGEIASGTVLLVTDKGIVQAGHAKRAKDLLELAGFSVKLFDRVHENPTTADVAACLDFIGDAEINLIVGLGGGSSMDTAKGTNFILTNGGAMRDYWGYGKASKPMLPMIAVPTTAGTGSECQSYALIADEHTHRKMACGDPKAAFKLAVLDPELTLTQPPAVTVATGVDTLTHALESLVSTRRNAVSVLFARESFRLVARHLTAVLQRPDDLHARAGMQLAAAYGGLAIENSMLGAAHAAANPLTARYDVVHGHAVGVVLTEVMRYNRAEPAAARAYSELAALSGLNHASEGTEAGVDALIGFVDQLLDETGLPRTLVHYGVEEEAIEELAAQAEEQWTGTFNPRKISAAEFAGLYRNLLGEGAGAAPYGRDTDHGQDARATKHGQDAHATEVSNG